VTAVPHEIKREGAGIGLSICDGEFESIYCEYFDRSNLIIPQVRHFVGEAQADCLINSKNGRDGDHGLNLEYFSVKFFHPQ
jgi:hypothetical protein